ncbi:MAG TPA: hypothetical protein VHN79_01275, partial [Lacunisphaera sp.]|nr:hypothetical protein [Lacunisphaera sp.]
AMMYGSVLSGGLAGHVHGTAAYDLTSTGEPAGWRPHIWTALRYESGAQMKHLRDFVLSEGSRYQDLQLASADISTRRAANPLDDGLEGWSFMMRTPAGDFALLYFENKAEAPQLAGFVPDTRYRWTWFNPRSAAWSTPSDLTTDAGGQLAIPGWPAGAPATINDWAAKLVRQP